MERLSARWWAVSTGCGGVLAPGRSSGDADPAPAPSPAASPVAAFPPPRVPSAGSRSPALLPEPLGWRGSDRVQDQSRCSRPPARRPHRDPWSAPGPAAAPRWYRTAPFPASHRSARAGRRLHPATVLGSPGPASTGRVPRSRDHVCRSPQVRRGPRTATAAMAFQQDPAVSPRAWMRRGPLQGRRRARALPDRPGRLRGLTDHRLASSHGGPSIGSGPVCAGGPVRADGPVALMAPSALMARSALMETLPKEAEDQSAGARSGTLEEREGSPPPPIRLDATSGRGPPRPLGRSRSRDRADADAVPPPLTAARALPPPADPAATQASVAVAHQRAPCNRSALSA